MITRNCFRSTRTCSESPSLRGEKGYLMAGIIQTNDFILESYCPADGPINLRLTHLPTGMRWFVKDRVGQTREVVQEELFQEAYRDLVAIGWSQEEAGPDSKH